MPASHCMVSAGSLGAVGSGELEGPRGRKAWSAWPVSIHTAQPTILRYGMLLPVILLACDTVMFYKVIDISWSIEKQGFHLTEGVNQILNYV